MGNIQNIFKKTEFRLLMQGLDAAGKTTILYKLKLGEVVTTIPTIEFIVETVQMNTSNVHFTVWDIGTRSQIRPLQRHYYPNTNALIFVIDSSDTERLDQAKDEMKITLAEDELRDCKVLILANKQDLSKAVSVTYLAEYLELHKLRHQCNIFGTCAVTGEGFEEAFAWLSDVIDSPCTPEKTSKITLSSDHRSGYFQKGIEAIKNLFAY